MREGQYLYLNCPYNSQDEWHPFTISSARGDLTSGPRVSLDTGEEVVQVPKPHELPPGAKWAKYCPVSQVRSPGSLESARAPSLRARPFSWPRAGLAQT